MPVGKTTSGEARKRVLLLTHRAPFPPNRGDRIRSYHMLRYLASHCDVYLGAVLDEPADERMVSALRELAVDVKLIPLNSRTRWVRAALSLAAGSSATEGLFASGQLRSQVERWAKEIRFDAVIAFCSSMVQFAKVAPLSDVPLIADLVDVDSQKWSDYAAATSGWKRWLFRLEASRVRKLESATAKRAAAITLVSEAEAELFRSVCPNERTYAVGNGVDLEYFRPDARRTGGRSRQAVFVGVLDYRANVEGLNWFCKEVWPLVVVRHPDAVFAIVGKNPAASVKRLASLPGIRLVGEVPDVRPYLSESRFSVAPLRIARGIQNKVLESMAMGVPVVATPQALEGLTKLDLPAMSAADPAEFASAMSLLFTDESLQSALSSKSRGYVERNHSWQSCLSPLLSLLRVEEVPTDRMSAHSGQRDLLASVG